MDLHAPCAVILRAAFSCDERRINVSGRRLVFIIVGAAILLLVAARVLSVW
jgi:hypothetical protein